VCDHGEIIFSIRCNPSHMVRILASKYHLCVVHISFFRFFAFLFILLSLLDEIEVRVKHEIAECEMYVQDTRFYAFELGIIARYEMWNLICIVHVCDFRAGIIGTMFGQFLTCPAILCWLFCFKLSLVIMHLLGTITLFNLR